MELSRFESGLPQDSLGGRCVVRWFYRSSCTADAVALILCISPEQLPAMNIDFQRAQHAAASKQEGIVEQFKHLTHYEGPILPEAQMNTQTRETSSDASESSQLGLF